MSSEINLSILPQPDTESCGATCLQALYSYYEKSLPVQEIISTLKTIPSGGTLPPYLGIDALQRGFLASIIPYDTRLFDPSWAHLDRVELQRRLSASKNFCPEARTRFAIEAYEEYLDAGGEVRFEDPTLALIEKTLHLGLPIVAGVNATYLYRCARETAMPGNMEYDDIRGQTLGHFVVACGCDSHRGLVQIADPQFPNPTSNTEQSLQYSAQHFLSSMLLGIVTYDSGFLIIRPSR